MNSIQKAVMAGLIDVDKIKEVSLDISRMCMDNKLSSLEASLVFETLNETVCENPRMWDMVSGRYDEMLEFVSEVDDDELEDELDSNGDRYKILGD